MTAFDWLKLLHVSCALLSVCGFAVRGYWVVTGHMLRAHVVTRVLPHAVDTVLLASALGMLWLWRQPPWATPWLSAKLTALLLYILLGMALMRLARTTVQRLAAYLAALLVAGYILAVALTHSALGPVAPAVG